MIGPWTIGAQLSTSHSSLAALDEQRMLDSVRRVLEALDLDLLIIGFREAPEVFRRFCAPHRPVDNVYLWFSALSDINGMTEDDLVVNWRGARSRGWGGWAEKGGEVEETFRFACPNNPAVREKQPCAYANFSYATTSRASSSIRSASLHLRTARMKCCRASAITVGGQPTPKVSTWMRLSGFSVTAT